MNGRSLGLRRLSVLLPCAFILDAGCGAPAARVPSDDALEIPADLGAESAAAVSIRFAIEVHSDVGEPVYVLLNGQDSQLGWVKAFRDGERVFFSERCEIEDCGAPPAVCGAAIPLIRRIAGAGDRGTIEFVWDGMTSIIDPRSGCEMRQPAPPGEYMARFCFSREAELEGHGDPTRAIQGRLIDPTCVEKPFTPKEEELVLRM